jgi:putative phosphoesterase
VRYVIFSDIHGNDLALQKMLSDVEREKIDGYIFCGDIMGYYYHQASVINQLMKIKGLISVKGNHDFHFLNSYNNEQLRISYAEKYGTSYVRNLSNDNLNYLKSLEPMVTTKIQGLNVVIVHGAIDNPLEGRIYPDTILSNMTLKEDTIIFCGHTHYRMFHNVNGSIMINPGSLGQPRDGNGFSYCIFDFDKLTCDFKNVIIDKNLLLELIDTNECYNNVSDYLKRKLD